MKFQALVTNMALFKNMLLTFDIWAEAPSVTYKIIDPQPIVNQWVKSIIYEEDKYIAFTNTRGIYLKQDFNNRNAGFIYSNSPELSCWEADFADFEKMDFEPLLSGGVYSLMSTQPKLVPVTAVDFQMISYTVEEVVYSEMAVSNKINTACGIVQFEVETAGSLVAESIELIANQSDPVTFSFTEFQLLSDTSFCSEAVRFSYGLVFSNTNIYEAISIDFNPEDGYLKFFNPIKTGQFKIRVQGSLPSWQAEYSAEIQLTIVGNDYAPAFETQLVDYYEVDAGIPLSYMLPPYSDLDGDTVILTLESTLNGVSIVDGIELSIDLPPLQAAGEYSLSMLLSDVNQYRTLSTVYVITLKVKDRLLLNPVSDCFSEPFPKVWSCNENSSITGTIVEVSDSFIVVIAEADSQCLNEYSNEIAFLVIAYELLSGKELWIIRITDSTDIIMDILQVVIDERANSIYLFVSMQQAKIKLIQLDIQTGDLLQVATSQSQFYLQGMALLDKHELAVLWGYQYGYYLSLVSFAQAPSILKSYLILSDDGLPITAAYSLSYESNTMRLFFSFQDSRQALGTSMLQYIDSKFESKWSATSQANPYTFDSVSFLDSLYDEHCSFIALSMLYFAGTQFYINVQMASFDQDHVMTGAQSNVIFIVIPPKVHAIKIINSGQVLLAVEDTATKNLALYSVYMNTHLVEVLTLGSQSIVSSNVMAIKVRSLSQVTFLQSVSSFTMQDSFSTQSMTVIPSSFLIHSSENLLNSCNNLTPVYNDSVFLDQWDFGEYVESTLTLVGTILDLTPDQYTEVRSYSRSQTNLLVQSICIKRDLSILTNNIPQQVLTFKTKSDAVQSLPFSKFSVQDSSCLDQVSFTYSVSALPGASLPPELTIAENILSMRRIEAPITFDATVTGQTLQGDIARATITIRVVNSNLGPPQFDEAFSQLEVSAGQKLTYQLPPYSDPDDDSVSASVNMLQATSFTQFASGVFVFAPPVTIRVKRAFIIKVTLTDSEGLATTQSLTLTVNPVDQNGENAPPLKNNSQNTTESNTPANASDYQDLSRNELIIEDDSEYYSLSAQNDEDQGKDTKAIVNLTAKISSISNRGLATILFSEAVMSVRNFNELLPEALKVTLFTQGEGRLVSWNYTKSNYTQTIDRLKIQLNFSSPILISQSKPLDDIQVTFIGNGLFRRQTDKRPIRYRYTVQESVPLQLVDSEAMHKLEDMGGAASDIMSFMGYSLLLMQIFMSVSMSLLWGLMHTMQIIINLRSLNVLMPINAHMVMSFIEKLASFKIGKELRNYAIEQIFRFLKKDEGEEEVLGKEDPDEMLQNVKLLLFGLVVFISLVAVFSAAYLLRNKVPIFNKVRDKLRNKLFYNGILRSLYATYLKVSIATFNAMALIDLTNGDSLMQSVITVVMLFGVTIGYPIFTYKLLSENKAQLQNPEFERKFACLLQHLNLKHQPRAWLMPCLFLGRRLVYAFSIAFLGNATLLQISLQIGSSIMMLYYLCNTMPYTDRLLNIVEIMNECSLLVCAYFLFCFSDFIGDVEFRFMMGWVFSGFVVLNLSTNWIILFARMLQPLFEKVSRFLRKRQRAKKEALEKLNQNLKNLESQYQQHKKELEEQKQQYDQIQSSKVTATSFT